jgi:superfamily II DNA or RNA helicase
MQCSFEDIKQTIKGHYSGQGKNIANEFYIPLLKRSNKYCRLSGYFSVSSLIVSAAGLVGLIRNNGTMKLVVGAHDISPELIEIFNMSKENGEYLLEEYTKKILTDLDKVEDFFSKKRLEALAWMLAANKLTIKVAIPKRTFLKRGNGIFHEKLILLEDSDGCKISSIGSANETYQAYRENGESLWVDMSWKPGGLEKINEIDKHFETIWQDQHPDYFVFSFPEAIKKKINYRFKKYEIPGSDPDEESNSTSSISFRDYQHDAINKWMNNDFKGIFEMATGTGKTFTALGCLQELIDIGKLVCVISCPGNALVQQWKREVNNFGSTSEILIADSSSGTSWKDKLTDALIEVSIGYKQSLIVITTHNTLSNKSFVNIIKNRPNKVNLFIIGDEVHRLGAQTWSGGLLDDYKYRLGLSATPERAFDDIGTNKIIDFFGGVVCKFTLHDAITKTNPDTGMTYLTPYKYVPYFVSLNNDELEEYIEETRKIIRLSYRENKNNSEKNVLELLLFKRADIVKSVKEKYNVLEEIIDCLGVDLKWTIIYCSPDQIDHVMNILYNNQIIAHKFTGEEGTSPYEKYGGISERDYLLKKFANGDYQVLVAMKILDEGIDVPPARVAIFMANSSNPLQYIQRIGRVIRRFPEKQEAFIYDMIVIPRPKSLPEDLQKYEKQIFEKELLRYQEISQNANNSVEALTYLDKVYFSMR